MRCRSAKKRLALFVGGDLPERKTPKLLSHLDCCADCAAELGALKRSQALVGKIVQADTPEPLPPDFSWKIHRRIVGERAKRSSSVWTGLGVLRWRPALLLGGIALALLLAFGLSQHVWKEGERPIAQRWEEVEQMAEDRLSDAELDAKYPTVESIRVPAEGTLMTLKLENDPSITVVWVF